MPSAIRHALAIAGAAIVFAGTGARAQSPEPPAAPHVRPQTPELRAMLEDLTSQSPTAQRLVERLEESDVVVYVRLRWIMTGTINGHIGLLATGGPTRFLIIELACQRTRFQQMVTLGHELRHAVEIAEAPSVIDTDSLSALYRRIGDCTSFIGSNETYETEAAAETSRRVRSELTTAQARERHAAEAR
jgi:hypothetical protein